LSATRYGLGTEELAGFEQIPGSEADDAHQLFNVPIVVLSLLSMLNSLLHLCAYLISTRYYLTVRALKAHTSFFFGITTPIPHW
jgi:hypothetical protein